MARLLAAHPVKTINMKYRQFLQTVIGNTEPKTAPQVFTSEASTPDMLPPFQIVVENARGNTRRVAAVRLVRRELIAS